MKTYKGLVHETYKRNARLEKIHDSFTDRFMREPWDLFIKIQNDGQSAREENWEVFDYQVGRMFS